MVISTLRRKSKFEFRTFLQKKNQILGFSWCSTREDLSIDVSITNVGLILTKLEWFLFSGYGQMDRRTDRRTDRQTDRQTDRHGFRILIWKHVGTQKISTQSSKLVVSCRSCLPGGRVCIIKSWRKTYNYCSNNRKNGLKNINKKNERFLLWFFNASKFRLLPYWDIFILYYGGDLTFFQIVIL